MEICVLLREIRLIWDNELSLGINGVLSTSYGIYVTLLAISCAHGFTCPPFQPSL